MSSRHEQPLLDKIYKSRRFSPKDHETIQRAFDFANTAHVEQRRIGGEPYITHPAWIAEYLAELGMDTLTIVSALLHDTVEDTDVKLSDIQNEFGDDVAFLVDGVTKLASIKFSRATRKPQKDDPKVASLKKMFFAMAEDVRVIIIKLVDRYHNMLTLSSLDNASRQRIAHETLEIYAPIAARLGMGHMKGLLEDLAFPYVYPEEYRTLLRSVKDKYEDRIRYIERTKPIIQRHLSDADIPIVSIHSRAKHYWSLYQKLVRYDMDIEKVTDLVAVRVIVPDIKSCYGALGIIHLHYKPLPGRIKDYIAVPKPNGYQSLHTTVFCEKGRLAEIQIRTEAMHKHGEMGIAAHWAYSESGKHSAVKADRKETQWIAQLREYLEDIKTRDGLTNLKIDFFKNRIFVFTPKGDVRDLPEGATPIDFAYAVHTDIGHSIAGARINEKMVTLATELKSGDVIEIIKSRSAKPSLDWLGITKTAQAKRLIKTWFKKNDPTIAVMNGKQALAKKLLEIGVVLEKLDRRRINIVLEKFSSRTMDIIYSRISMGDLNATDIAHSCFPVEFRNLHKKRHTPSTKRTKTVIHHNLSVPFNIQGHTGLLYRVARCCNPEPDQPVAGYMTQTRGVTIHTASCKNIKSADSQRLLDVHWT